VRRRRARRAVAVHPAQLGLGTLPLPDGPGQAWARPSRGGPTPVRLALAGAVLTALLVSLTSAVLVFDARTLDEFRFWIVGSIAGATPA
jgi:hypothetical protein